jgi:hypothetical protein
VTVPPAPPSVPLAVLVALVVVAFGAGVGITAVGPGGVFLTVALYALTAVPTATVAGTATTTFVFTGLLGTASYVRSGELADRGRLRLAAALSLGGVAGALLGVELNAVVSERAFGALLGGFLVVAAALVWRQSGERGTADDGDSRSVPTEGRIGAVGGAAVGLFVGTAGGLLGVGGPVLAVPILVTGGVPMLAAVAAAQVQSVFVSGFAATGYVARGAVSLPLAVLVGVPELLGVLVGWRVAHRVPSARLKRVLAAVLAVLGPYVALTT